MEVVGELKALVPMNIPSFINSYRSFSEIGRNNEWSQGRKRKTLYIYIYIT